MDINNVRTNLISVLQMIQDISGLDCPLIDGRTKPNLDLPDFDSKVWPIATGLLGDRVGIQIPHDVNIFCDKKSDGEYMCLTIDQIADRVTKLPQKKVYLNDTE